jgi:hypothetical protein
MNKNSGGYKMENLDRRRIQDIIAGSTFLGAGGGGSGESGKLLLNTVLKNKKIQMVNPDEITDECNVAVVAGQGSPEVLLKKGFSLECVNSLKLLEEIKKESIDYVVPFELGGFNTITPMTVTAEKGLPIINGDGCGRAVPELQQTTYSLSGIAMNPITVSDDVGNSAILFTKNAVMAENLSRSVTSELGGITGFATYFMTGKELKKSVIPETITYAENVGHIIRVSAEKKEDPGDALIKKVNGEIFIRGDIIERSTKTIGGFDFGKTKIKGKGDFAGKELVIEYKNENMLARNSNGQILMEVPDLICVMEENGNTWTNADLKKGMKVVVVGIKAHEKWTQLNGKKVFSHILEKLKE